MRACAAPRRALPLQLPPLLTRPGPAQHGPTRMPARPKRPDSDAGPPNTARLGCRPAQNGPTRMPARPKRPDSDVGQPKTARLGCRQQTSATSGRAVTGGPRRGPVALPVSESARRMPPVGRPGRPGLHSGPGRRLGGFKLPAAAESERLAPSRPGDEWPATPPAGGSGLRAYPSHAAHFKLGGCTRRTAAVCSGGRRYC